ncbi:MAG: hypothetical protein ACE5HI_17280 [bacterium]
MLCIRSWERLRHLSSIGHSVTHATKASPRRKPYHVVTHTVTLRPDSQRLLSPPGSRW